MFYINILEALNAPHRVTDKSLQLYKQVTHVLRKVQNKVLIIDEIHHILAGSYVNQRAFLNVIKYLANDLQIVIIGSGVRDALSAINRINNWRTVLSRQYCRDGKWVRNTCDC